MDTSNKSSIAKRQHLLHAILEFSTAFKSNIESHSIDAPYLTPGVRIGEIFHNEYTSSLNTIKVLDNLTDSEILIAVKNAQGTKPILYANADAFTFLVRSQIGRFEVPSLYCVDLICDQLEEAILASASHVTNSKLSHIEDITNDIEDVARKLVGDCAATAKEIIKSTIAMEMAYINTKHPDFKYELPEDVDAQKQQDPIPNFDQLSLTSESTINENAESRRRATKKDGIKKRLKQYFQKKTKPESIASTSKDTLITILEGDDVHGVQTKTEPKAVETTQPLNESQIVELMKRMTVSYCNLVRKIIEDRVPKIIMQSLVNPVMEKLQYALFDQLYKVCDCVDESKE